MKLRTSELQAMISRMVQEEIDRILPTLVAESISEIYQRGLVTEAVSRASPAAPRPRPRIQQQVMEEEPSPFRRDVPTVSAMVSRNPLLEQKNPFKDIYEGTSPIDDSETAPADNADLSKLGIGLGVSGMRRLAGLE